MTDVLLIQPPIQDFYLTAKRSIPYGLASIGASLIQRGFSVQIFDALASRKVRSIELPQEMAYLREFYPQADASPFGLFYEYKHFGYSFEYIGKIAKDSDAFLVGISSLFTAYSHEALTVAEIVKKNHPRCQIVIGGHHATALPKAVMECEAVDFVIRGEGEMSLPLLANALKNKTSLENIPGIVFRASENKLYISKPAVVKNLNALPLPALDFVNHRFYSRKNGASAVITTSRGCPMKCTYCSMGASGLPYRRRNLKNVLEEIDQSISQYNARFIDFEDENLSLDKAWFLNLLAELQKRFGHLGVELRAMNGLFAPSLDDEVIWAMKQAGFKTLNLSLGSTSLAQLQRFQRPDVRKSIENAIQTANKYELETVCYIIVSAPGQTSETSIQDLLYLADSPALAGASVYYPAPGSEDYKKLAQADLLPAHFSLMRSTALPIYDKRLKSLTFLRLGRILNFMKFCASQGEDLPLPAPLPENISKSRHAMGRSLLAAFLYDAEIRGITPSGQVYEVPADKQLTRRFIHDLRIS